MVAPIHPKAMPVILTTAEEVDLWLAADTAKALELQRPLPDSALRIVATGEKEDRAPALVRCAVVSTGFVMNFSIACPNAPSAVLKWAIADIWLCPLSHTSAACAASLVPDDRRARRSARR